MGDEEYKAHRRDVKRQCTRDARQRQSQAPVAVAGEEGSKDMWVGPRDAAVIATVRALLRPSNDQLEEFHRLAKLEMVLDPRCGDLDPLELQGAYIKLLKQAVDAKEYTTGRKTEGHTFNNQGGCALGLVREMLDAD
jgi:hypothetical protein